MSRTGTVLLSLPRCRQAQQREQGALLVMCRMEEAKQLWAQGQQSMAVRVVRALLGSSGSAVPMEKLQRSRLQSLLGKWLSLNRLSHCTVSLTFLPGCKTALSVLRMANTVIRILPRLRFLFCCSMPVQL